MPLHELGHLLGFDHADKGDALMAELLEAGNLRLPEETTSTSTLTREEPTTVVAEEAVTSTRKGRWFGPLLKVIGKG